MSDHVKPKSAYPTTEAWLADLDHSRCSQGHGGTCREIHCVFCGKALPGDGMVRCRCAGAVEAWGSAR